MANVALIVVLKIFFPSTDLNASTSGLNFLLNTWVLTVLKSTDKIFPPKLFW